MIKFRKKHAEMWAVINEPFYFVKVSSNTEKSIVVQFYLGQIYYDSRVGKRNRGQQ